MTKTRTYIRHLRQKGRYCYRLQVTVKEKSLGRCEEHSAPRKRRGRPKKGGEVSSTP